MGSTLSGALRILAGLFFLAFGFCAAAGAQPLLRSVTVGSNPPGTVFYALASGLSKVVSEGAPFQMVVQPYSGTSTFLPLLDSGELDFGSNNAVDMALSYQGAGALDRLAQSVSTHAQCPVSDARGDFDDGAAGAQRLGDENRAGYSRQTINR